MWLYFAGIVAAKVSEWIFLFLLRVFFFFVLFRLFHIERKKRQIINMTVQCSSCLLLKWSHIRFALYAVSMPSTVQQLSSRHVLRSYKLFCPVLVFQCKRIRVCVCFFSNFKIDDENDEKNAMNAAFEMIKSKTWNCSFSFVTEKNLIQYENKPMIADTRLHFQSSQV